MPTHLRPAEQSVIALLYGLPLIRAMSSVMATAKQAEVCSVRWFGIASNTRGLW
ncbi:hypothetical protein DEU38_112141 [Rhodococcus sp. AG1013]|nr:hypothetical protein DEU38_112141 [Rhodococcus sp. AG1013]